MAFMVSSSFQQKCTLFTSCYTFQSSFLWKAIKQMASSSHPLVSSDQKRPVEGITGKFNVVISILGFHRPGLSGQKPSLALYVWFGASCVAFLLLVVCWVFWLGGWGFGIVFFFLRKDMKHYSITNQVFLASHSSRQLPLSLTNFFYVIKVRTLLKKVSRCWWVASRD